MAVYYPIYLDIEGKTCLIVGGGPVAERRVQSLLEAGAQVRVVSLTLTAGLQALSDSGTVETIIAPYAAHFLDGVALVFAATNDRTVNAQITADARERSLPINVADAPDEGSFIVPSVVRRGDLCISVATGGASPILTSRLCDEFAMRFGPEYGEFVELLGTMRDTIKQSTDNPTLRRRALASLIDAESELRELLRADQREEAAALANDLISRILVG